MRQPHGFPPERGPVLIIGNAASVFPRHLAALWRSMGIDAHLLTRRWTGDAELACGARIHASASLEAAPQTWRSEVIERIVSAIEAPVVRWQSARYRRAMGSETSYRPMISGPVSDAWSIARAARRLRPQFVCGMEVFSYGLATALCHPTPTMLMPWGGDVYMYADTTSLASALVRYALRSVDLVVPGSDLAAGYLHDRFGVRSADVHVGGLWALDRTKCRPLAECERARLRARLGIDPQAFVVMNIRRFFPAWGSDLALRAFMTFAGEHPAAHFICLGGAGTESWVADARLALDRGGLTGRFTLAGGDIPNEACRDLMACADVCVSLMRERDMRPFASILEAAACGAAPVIGDQDEYRAMEKRGFSAIFCRPGEIADVVSALRTYAADVPLRRRTVERNASYLDRHEDGRSQAVQLLDRMRAICDARERGDR